MNRCTEQETLKVTSTSGASQTPRHVSHENFVGSSASMLLFLLGVKLCGTLASKSKHSNSQQHQQLCCLFNTMFTFTPYPCSPPLNDILSRAAPYQKRTTICITLYPLLSFISFLISFTCSSQPHTQTHTHTHTHHTLSSTALSCLRAARASRRFFRASSSSLSFFCRCASAFFFRSGLSL